MRHVPNLRSAPSVVAILRKRSLTVKSFNELLQSIPPEDKVSFSKDKAEQYYRSYQENYIDDKEMLDRLRDEIGDKPVVLLAPGKTLSTHSDAVRAVTKDSVVIAANFLATEFEPNYIFSSNMRRFVKIQGKTSAKCIITSNMKEATQRDFVVNFSSYASKNADIIDNSALMLLKLLNDVGVKEVKIAGMDGYSEASVVYYDNELNYDFSKEAKKRNKLISDELREIGRHIKLEFVTPTEYRIS